MFLFFLIYILILCAWNRLQTETEEIVCSRIQDIHIEAKTKLELAGILYSFFRQFFFIVVQYVLTKKALQYLSEAQITKTWFILLLGIWTWAKSSDELYY